MKDIITIAICTGLAIINYLEYREKPTKYKKAVTIIWTIMSLIIFYGIIREI